VLGTEVSKEDKANLGTYWRQEEDDSLYMAPGSQEASFFTVEEEAVPTSTVSKKSVSSALNRAGTPEKKVVHSVSRNPYF
jgi:hypothetical protein